MKNHLLFRANRRLRLRVVAMPNFNYGSLKVDGLINLLSTTYTSLLDEGLIRAAFNIAIAAPPSGPPTTERPVLSDQEHDRVCAAGGCFNCGKTPKSAD